MEKFVCIHGHFYQPPRENPWLEEVELEESAHPYHDWNARITAECYGPNSASRVMDAEWRIMGLVNNYSKMSFNFGPTLLYWMERGAPEVYQSIIDADRNSVSNFSGHGSAIAQVYNHIIMPLANSRDKETQVKWGIRDFEARFKRQPEGMWLPETAVDTETLEVLAENGIKFTILAQHQAAKVRKIGDEKWTDVDGSKIDPRRAYLCRLPSGKTIALFFIDKMIANDMAFGRLLESGEDFAKRIAGAFGDISDDAAIISLATDGEMYGHHHVHGDMALAYCFDYLEKNNLARVTNYAEYLEKHPPMHEVQVNENTSWSCFHGIERWRSDCGCNTGRPEWRQAWRKPLRDAMDWLRDNLAQRFEYEARKYLKDPWQARDEYIEVILDRSRSKDVIDGFLSKHVARDLTDEDRRRTIRLLEMQRHAMLMYTSCGWFFDELSGLETVQVIKYAARALQLARGVLDADLEGQYVKMLEQAPSNLAQYGNGAGVYEALVKPAVVDLVRVGLHHVMISLFADRMMRPDSPHTFNTCCFKASVEGSETNEAGKFRLIIGRSKISSQITLDEALISYAALWLGDHNVSCGIMRDMKEESYEAMHSEIMDSFKKGQINESIVLMSKHFGGGAYSLKDLMKDDQRDILDFILADSLKKSLELYEVIFKDNYATMRFMNEIRIPPPKPFRAATDIVLSEEIRRVISSEKIDLELLERLVSDSRLLSIAIDAELIGLEAGGRIADELAKFMKSPEDLELLESIQRLVGIVNNLPIKLNLWQSQNLVFRIAQSHYQQVKQKQDEVSQKWASSFERLSESLGVRLK